MVNIREQINKLSTDLNITRKGLEVFSGQRKTILPSNTEIKFGIEFKKKMKELKVILFIRFNYCKGQSCRFLPRKQKINKYLFFFFGLKIFVYLQKINATNKTTELELSVNEDLVISLSQAFQSQAACCK